MPFPSGLTTHHYAHQVTTISSSGDPAVVVMPNVHLVVGLLKRWLLGTFHGGVSREHLGYYLDEFTFRYNRRTARARGLLFYRLLEQAVRTRPGVLSWRGPCSYLQEIIWPETTRCRGRLS